MKALVVVASALAPVGALAYYAYVVIPRTVGGFEVLGWFPFDSLMVGVWVVIVLAAVAIGLWRIRDASWPRVTSRAAEVYTVTTLAGMVCAVLVMSTAAATLESRDIHVTVMSEGAWAVLPRLTVIGIVVYVAVSVVARAAEGAPRRKLAPRAPGTQ